MKNNNQTAVRTSKKHRLLASAIIFASLLPASMALAQQTEGEAVTEAAAPVPRAPMWVVSCSNNNTNAALQCEMSQSVVMVESGQRLASASLSHIKDSDGAMRLRISLPLGFDLTGGAKLSLDDALIEEVAIRSCNQNGCYAGITLAADVIEKFGSGEIMSIEILRLDGATLKFNFDLDRFETSMEAMPTG